MCVYCVYLLCINTHTCMYIFKQKYIVFIYKIYKYIFSKLQKIIIFCWILQFSGIFIWINNKNVWHLASKLDHSSSELTLQAYMPLLVYQHLKASLSSPIQQLLCLVCLPVWTHTGQGLHSKEQKETGSDQQIQTFWKHNIQNQTNHLKDSLEWPACVKPTIKRIRADQQPISRSWRSQNDIIFYP